MYFIGGKVDYKKSQAKKRRTSHHLANKNQEENREKLTNVILQSLKANGPMNH
jgi:hypothetical protein